MFDDDGAAVNDYSGMTKHDILRLDLACNINKSAEKHMPHGKAACHSDKCNDEQTMVTVEEFCSDFSDSFSLASSKNTNVPRRKSWKNYSRMSCGTLRDSSHGDDDEDNDGSMDLLNFENSGHFVFNSSCTAYNKSANIKTFAKDIDAWDLIKILGEGAFGQVAQVEKKQLDLNFSVVVAVRQECYALKMLSKYQLLCDRQIDIAINEKRNLQTACDHPFVVKLHATWQDENLVFLLQEFVQGGELFSLLRCQENDNEAVGQQRKSLEESHAQFYAACLADALHYLHSKCRIVYRDLKPENVLLDDQGYPKLIDFGASKRLTTESSARDKMYHTMTLCGTPAYVAPEQISGSGHSFGVDHWALAVLVYEMVLAQHPFDEWDGENEFALYERVVSEDEVHPTLPESLSENLQKWINQLLVKDPVNRLGYSSSIQTEDDDSCGALHRHPWLSSIDVKKLRCRAIQAPWVPTLHSLHDSTHFDDWDHLEPVFTNKNQTKLSIREEALFADFDK